MKKQFEKLMNESTFVDGEYSNLDDAQNVILEINEKMGGELIYHYRDLMGLTFENRITLFIDAKNNEYSIYMNAPKWLENMKNDIIEIINNYTGINIQEAYLNR